MYDAKFEESEHYENSDCRKFHIPETGITFLMQEFYPTPDSDSCAIETQITSIHPYDLTNYHYAKTIDYYYWDIYRNGNFVACVKTHQIGLVAHKLLEYDKAAGLKACIDRT